MTDLEETVSTYVSQAVSKRRWQHIQGVVDTISLIAQAHRLSEQHCRLAAWLHDAAKEQPREAFQELVKGNQIMIDPESFANPKLWHGYHAAWLASKQFGILDEDILEAVRYHPTGTPGWGVVGLALFVADFAEPTRDISEAEGVRSVVRENLVLAAFQVAQKKLDYIKTKGKQPHSRGVAFLHWLENHPAIASSDRVVGH